MHASKRGSIHLITSTTPLGWSMYFYVQLQRGKERKFFAEMKKQKNVNLHDYAEILYSGVGSAPSASSITYMQQHYHYTTPEVSNA